MKILIAAGGTGGHIYPALALAQALQQDRHQLLFIGTRGGLEKKVLSPYQFELAYITLYGLQRKFSFKALLAVLTFPFALWQSFRILRKFKPGVVVLMGGYVSLPVALAAKVLRLPILLHEQNVLPGLTSRLVWRLVDRVALAFAESLKYLAGTVCGNPIRQQMYTVNKEAALQNFKLDKSKKTLLVLGGSQGALKINQALAEIVNSVPDLDFQILHICGERDYFQIKNQVVPGLLNYRLIPYLHQIWEALAVADLVVSRAGAMAISEILFFNLPAIIIPFPYAAEGHQDLNAQALAAKGAAWILSEDKLSAESLLSIIKVLFRDEVKLKNMSANAKALSQTDATAKIMELIYELV